MINEGSNDSCFSAEIILVFRSTLNPAECFGLKRFFVKSYLGDICFVCPPIKDTTWGADDWQPLQLRELMCSDCSMFVNDTTVFNLYKHFWKSDNLELQPFAVCEGPALLKGISTTVVKGVHIFHHRRYRPFVDPGHNPTCFLFKVALPPPPPESCCFLQSFASLGSFPTYFRFAANRHIQLLVRLQETVGAGRLH